MKRAFHMAELTRRDLALSRPPSVSNFMNGKLLFFFKRRHKYFKCKIILVDIPYGTVFVQNTGNDQVFVVLNQVYNYEFLNKWWTILGGGEQIWDNVERFCQNSAGFAIFENIAYGTGRNPLINEIIRKLPIVLGY
jgi:hypothetical protein